MDGNAPNADFRLILKADMFMMMHESDLGIRLVFFIVNT